MAILSLTHRGGEAACPASLGPMSHVCAHTHHGGPGGRLASAGSAPNSTKAATALLLRPVL